MAGTPGSGINLPRGTVTISPDSALRNNGGFMPGVTKATKPAVTSPFAPKSGFASVGRGRAAQTQASQQGSGNSNLDNIMALLMGAGGGSGGGGGISQAQIQAMQDRGAQDRARIEALYGNYAKMIGDRQAAIAGNYETGTKNLTDAYAQSGAANDAAYNAAREAQTRQLQQLGLTEMAPPTNVEAQMSAAKSNEALKQAAIAQQEANRQAAINQNISLQNAASREGTQQLGSFDQRLADTISQMQMSRGGGGGGGGGVSPSDIIRAYLGASELDMKQQGAETQKAIEAAKLAAAGGTKDWASLYDQLVNTKGLDPKDAISLLGLYS